jgi:FSR family fosmidomycin resistance protein-like MFS transporter
MPHVIRKQGVLSGTGLALFLALVHTVNDTITAMLGALLPTLQVRFDAGPTLLALMVATYSVASSVTQPFFGALAEERGLRLVGAIGVLLASLFLSLIGVAPALILVFTLLVIGGMGSAALHPVGTAIAGGPNVSNRALGIGVFTTGGMIGFALGPVVILYIVARFGLGATPWLMVPGIALSLLVFLLLPIWELHPHRSLLDRLGVTRLKGPIGWLTLASALTSVAFLSFISSIPLWMVQDHGVARDSSTIGWTLAVFSLFAGAGSVLGGLLTPRIGRRPAMVGSMALAAVPLLVLLALEPGSPVFYITTAAAGLLLYISSPVKVVVAQDLAPQEPASVAGVVLGTSTGVAGLLYIGLGQIQGLIGITAGAALGFGLLLPAAAIALGVFAKHPEIAR